MVPIGDVAQVKACFGLSDIVLILMQDKCTVCVERTIGLDIVLDAPDGTPRRRWSCGISLLSVWNNVLVSMEDRCMVCARCTIGLQIVLDAADGTPR